jgi:hypothetical protein
VGRAARYLADPEGRVLFLHGVTVTPGTVPGPDALNRWVADGFTAVRLTARVAADGSFPGRGGAVAPGAPDVGLDELAASARAFTDRGFRVLLRIAPSSPGTAVAPAVLAAAVTRISARFAPVGGLVGFEVDLPAGAALGELFAAVRKVDPSHLLWWADTSPLDPRARVARNDSAYYIVDWGATTPDGVAALAKAADAAQVGWFYEAPAAGGTLPVLTRPYPAAVAGIPLGFASDDAGVFTLEYSTTPVGGGRFAGGAATAVVVPAAAYPNGYRVVVVGARVTSLPGAGVLCLVAEPTAAHVQLRVEPALPGTAVPVTPSAAVSTCAAPSPATTASGQGPGQGPGGSASARSPEAAGTGSGDGSGGDDVALLVLFPLLGAVGTAVLLGGALGLLRGRRPARSQPL